MMMMMMMMMIALSCDIKMSAVVLSQSTRVTDGRTDRITTDITALAQLLER